MNILFVASEVAPFSKAGGLADVAGSLPRALKIYVSSMLVITPLYGIIDQKKYKIKPLEYVGKIWLGQKTYPYSIFEATSDSSSHAPTWFIRSEQFFDRQGIYTDESGEGFPDNNLRYFFFQLVIMDLLSRKIIDFDILHCNDHHTGLLPALLKLNGINRTTVFTIHNFLYHGHFSEKELGLLPESLGRTFKKTQWSNYSALLEGITHADIVTTVSRGYAKELLAGENLDSNSIERLQALKNGLTGIVNGIDTDYWNPGVDEHLTFHYSPNDLTGKSQNKSVLLNHFKLSPEMDMPVIGSISRLVENKGFPLIVEVLEEYAGQGVKFVFLGSGDPHIAKQLQDLHQRFPNNIGFEDGFNEPLAHLIEAGADMFLMPSRFEPCGLNQLYSLRYGTIPIVNRTGGLGDTVLQWSPGMGTGFLFEPYRVEALRESLELALQTFSIKAEWVALIKRAMSQDFSWDWSAQQYFKLYESRK
ncbi:MAG: glycogen synthase [Candidatus Marinimicrobia bacterium]|nr:glycogen synthase [Candidatus Neomarinimicrobiota bacterium]